jgi:uncharacterized protein (TIGR03435 family)
MRRQSWKHASRGVGIGFACVALLIATANCLCGQDKSSAEGPAAASAQPAQHDYRFEVASIRPTTRTGFPNMEALRAAHSFTPGRYKEEQACLACLAREAFDIKHSYQIESPHWMNDEYFTLNATVPGGATKADLPIMLQHLLQDRFALKYHHETRQMAGYELVVAKSGPKLTKSSEPPDPSKISSRGFEVKDGVPQFDKNSGPQQVYVGSPAGLVTWWHGRDETMQRLASDISDRINVPVTDSTGLEEKYDFSLNFIEENSSAAAPAAAGDASTPSNYPPLRDALREQLGLELKPVKNIPIDVVVIDSANKEPTEN